MFRKFRKSRIFLVGAGRLGSLVAESWVRMGVRQITIVDPDILESHNLDATFGSLKTQIGQDKVAALVEHLHKIRPETLIRGVPSELWHRAAIDQARSCDLIITCVDNDQARYAAAVLAKELLKIHIDLGTIVRQPPPTDGMHSSTTSDFTEYDREIGADIRLLLPRSCVVCVGGLRDAQSVRTQFESGQRTDARNFDWQAGGRAGSLASINHFAAGCSATITSSL